MSNNAQVQVGFISNAVTTGLNRLRQGFKSFRNDVSSEFSVGKFLAVGAILAGLNAILDKAGQVNDTAGRFGIGAEGLQRISNAAEQNGASMESVAKAMNKLVLAQDKVKNGDDEVTKSLETLGIKAEDFINMDSEQAFYAIADATKNADDRTAAYAAVTALMGKNSGELFTTLEQGSDSIRQVGDAAGVMSEKTVAALDECGDKLSAAKNQLMAWGAELLAWLLKAGQTVGVLAAKGWAVAGNWVGALSQEERDNLWNAANEGYDEIWHPKEMTDEEKKAKARKRVTDTDDLEEKAKAAKDVEAINARIAENKRKQLLAEMDAQSRINEIIKERDELQRKADGEKDAKKKAEALLKVSELEADIMAERKRVADDEERKEERIAKKKEELEKRRADNQLSALATYEEKAAELAKRKADLEERISQTSEDDKEALLDLLMEREDLSKQQMNLREDKQKEEKDKTEVVASSLAKIGGGGGAILAQKSDAAERTAKAAEKTAQKSEAALRELQQIKEKIGQARWNP